MKTGNIILLAAVLVLCQCKKDSEEPYPNENIVMDNAQAALYFHTVFREAEYAWAFIDSKGYKEGTYTDDANRVAGSKELIYNENTKIVTIKYHIWETNHLTLAGSMDVKFGVSSYRDDGQIANVYLTDLSINWQTVVGESAIKYRKGENSANDYYMYTLLEGAAIHEEGGSMPVLISSTITNGQYERIEGCETLMQGDDLWAFSGVMTGLLHNDPNLKYTNTVIPNYTLNGESKNGRIYYTMNCKLAKQGFSQITIAKRPDIFFEYDCSKYNFVSVTQVQ